LNIWIFNPKHNYEVANSIRLLLEQRFLIARVSRFRFHAHHLRSANKRFKAGAGP